MYQYHSATVNLIPFSVYTLTISIEMFIVLIIIINDPFLKSLIAQPTLMTTATKTTTSTTKTQIDISSKHVWHM